MDLFDKLGGQKYQVFKYIIENRSRDNNTLVTTNKELSRLTKTSTKTVQDTINLLKEAGLIERRMGAIMLNPKLVHRGSNQKKSTYSNGSKLSTKPIQPRNRVPFKKIVHLWSLYHE